MNPEPPPVDTDWLGQILEGTDDPLHNPDPTLGALGRWCDDALYASRDRDAATQREALDFPGDTPAIMNDLKLAHSAEQRIFLLLVLLNYSANWRSLVGQHTPAVLYEPFLEYLADAFTHLLQGTRSDGQTVQHPNHTDFRSLSEFVYRVRIWYLTSCSLTTWRPS